MVTASVRVSVSAHTLSGLLKYDSQVRGRIGHRVP